MGLGINVAFSFFMKHIYICIYTHTEIHTCAKSFKWTRDRLHKEVQAQRRLPRVTHAAASGLRTGGRGRCSLRRVAFLSGFTVPWPGRPGRTGEGTSFPSRQQGPHFPAQPSDRAGPADPSGSGMATFAETREKDNTFRVLDGLLVSIGDCSPATQAGRRELCDEPAALSPDGASRSPRPHPGHPLRWADGWRGAGCGEPSPAPHGLS